ncbi:MAG TPA: hypothetical protein VG387_20490 [Rhizomicrobium sp.]|nr:hypothetical protein [Rhizomicrobium sp.]
MVGIGFSKSSDGEGSNAAPHARQPNPFGNDARDYDSDFCGRNLYLPPRHPCVDGMVARAVRGM